MNFNFQVFEYAVQPFKLAWIVGKKKYAVSFFLPFF